MCALLTGSTFFFRGPPRLALGSDRDMLAACIPPFLRRAGWILPLVGPCKAAGWLAGWMDGQQAASPSLALPFVCIEMPGYAALLSPD